MNKKIVIACAALVLITLLFFISAFVTGIVSPPPVDSSAATVIKAVDSGAKASESFSAAEAPETVGPSVRKTAETSIQTKTTGTIQVNGERYVATIEKGTVYDLMEEARSKGFVFETEYHSGLGFFITSISGTRNDPASGRYWTLYVNGKRSSLGASNYPLANGTSIEWKLEKN